MLACDFFVAKVTTIIKKKVKKHFKCYSFISNIYKNQNLNINDNKLKEREEVKRG
jgi:hypothetical protein